MQDGEFQDETFRDKARALRPFYFIVAVWGERFTDLLLNFCVSSLLSPNNIPALLNSGNKFLIATTNEDWGRMQTKPMLQLLKQYVEPVFLRIPTFPKETNKYLHMGVGHNLATNMAFEDRAYAAILTPDLMVSDGTVAALQRHAVNGVQVVLTAALRFGEEPLFEHLREMGIVLDSQLGEEGRPLAVTSRQLVGAGIQSFHSETLRYEWDSPDLWHLPAAIWWRVPEEDGVIVHTLSSWAPLLIDYAAIAHHDTSVIDNMSIDGNYIHSNFGLNGRVHVVQDSDEIMLASWGPVDVGKLPPHEVFKKSLFSEWEKKMFLYSTAFHPYMDPLKREFFRKPVYWHAHDINSKWDIVEKKAAEIVNSINSVSPMQGALLIHLAKYRLKFHLFDPVIVRLAKRVIGLGAYAKSVFIYYWGKRQSVWGLIAQASRGDPAARERIKHSFQIIVNRVRVLRKSD